jgi:dimethylhistidine N-methyltransferase
MRWLAPLQVRRYVGVDIAPGWLRSTLQRGARAYPDIEFSGVVTDFTHGLDIRAQLDPDAPRIFFYPGSSIGNFDPADAARLLGEVRQHLRRNDRLLIGVDAPKDPATLVAAYDDALGVTAAFNRNVLRVVNEELGTDFELGNFSHRALFDERHSRIEMHLLARQATTVRLSAQHERRFEAGEAIVTEHSYKYEPARFLALLERAGYGDVSCFQDESAGYGVYVAGVGPGLQ